jgi:hypothetical protein
MRNSRLLLAALAIALGATVAGAEDVATGNVSVTANFKTRTSLKVSSRLLKFDVTQPGATATAAIEFTAGARMPSGSDVVLTVEPLRGLHGPGGAADVETDLSFSGEGDGLTAGSLSSSAHAVVGRWQGSGLRTGRVVFKLRADAAGSYSMPVRFVLSTP